MEKTELIRIFNDVLIPFGFRKRRGMIWIYKGNEISELIYLQKSTYADKYYFHYDYIINTLNNSKLKPHTMTNAISNKQKYDAYCTLLDLENTMPDEKREKELLSILKDTINEVFGKIISENQLKEFIISRGLVELLIVKKHLGIK